MQVDEEIKNYISIHKHDLMAGMQDVAVLSKRYQTLQATSNRLRHSVDKMKRETFDSFAVIQSRTLELERIHQTAALLRQLRQFTHAKAQLDHYSASSPLKKSTGESGELDLRQFATIAKTVQELEQLLQSPQLVSLSIVSSQVSQIRTFGDQMRDLAQVKLLEALRDQDQATVADCLQVFFNLQSLSQVVLMAIDATVKDTIELCAASLNFDLITEGGNSSGSTKVSTSTKLRRNMSNGGSDTLLSNSSQLRVAMREMCHNWAGVVQEQAVKVHVLQRVIAKKEDPSTHKKFMTVLFRDMASASTIGQLKDQNITYSPKSEYFSLLELYWKRLSSSLQDVLFSKIKHHPVSAPRIYPNLRRAAVEVYEAFKVLAAGDVAENEAYGTNYGVFDGLPVQDDSNGWGEEDKECEMGVRRSTSLFGSIGATATSLSSFGLVVAPATYASLRMKRALAAEKSKEKGMLTASAYTPTSRGRADSSAAASLEEGILPSLSPLRDRYLMAALSRMTAPVLQMFPEVEGYTAAVPSKRDLQALLKTVQEEVVHVVLEGDRSLVKIIAKEALKAVQLLLTKVEGMISAGLESTRIHLSKDGYFLKTNQQEHNYQLLQLLTQLTGFIEVLPSQIIKITKDSPSFALSRFFSGSDKSNDGDIRDTDRAVDNGESVLREEMQYFVKESIRSAQELAGKQLLHPMVEALTTHFRHQLLGLLKEGVAGGANASASKTLSTVMEQFPRAINTYFDESSSSSGTTTALPLPVATRELCARLVMTYISIVALRRPVTEQCRLQTAAEISAIDMMVAGLTDDKNHPVLSELRFFRRFIFEPIESVEDDNQGKGQVKLLLGTDLECTPVPSKVTSLPYLFSLRPSTVIGYLLSCGPRQLPAITESCSFDNSSGNSSVSSKKKNKSLDSLIHTSESTSSYIKMITSPCTVFSTSSTLTLSGAFDSSTTQKTEMRHGSGNTIELELLGASVRHCYSHTLSGSWKDVCLMIKC